MFGVLLEPNSQESAHEPFVGRAARMNPTQGDFYVEVLRQHCVQTTQTQRLSLLPDQAIPTCFRQIRLLPSSAHTDPIERIMT